MDSDQEAKKKGYRDIGGATSDERRSIYVETQNKKWGAEAENYIHYRDSEI